MEHFFAYTARMRFISRWALMRNSQPENIQEHSHMVAVLAHGWRSSGATSSAFRPIRSAAPRRRCSTMPPKF